MFEAYVKILEKKKKVFIPLLVAVNILAIIGVFHVRINPDFKELLASDSEAKRNYEAMVEKFETGNQLIYMLELPKNPFGDVSVFKELRSLQSVLEKEEDIASVSGPAPQKIFSGLRLIDIGEIDESDLPLLEDFLKDMGELNPIVERSGKHYAVFNIFLKPEVDDSKAIKDVDELFASHSFNFNASGEFYLQKKLSDYILSIIVFLPPLAISLIFLVFRFQMGSIKATFLSILPAGLGALWTMGVMGWSGRQISVVTILAPIFTIVMGSADGLHFMSHFLNRIEDGKSGKPAVQKALDAVGVPMIMTTVTTIGGFMSLMATGNSAMGELAIFASLGIAFAGIATWLFLPLVTLNITRFKVKHGKHRSINNWLKKLWGKPIVVIAIVVVLLSIPGINLLKVEFNQLDIFKKRTEVYKSFMAIQRVYDGVIPVFVTIKTNKDQLDPQTAEKIAEKERELLDSGLVTKVVSIYDVMSNLNRHIYNLKEPSYPKNIGIANLLYVAITSQKGNPIKNFLIRKENLSRMMAFPADLSDKTIEGIEEIVSSWNSFDATYTAIGMPFIMKEMNDSVVPSQVTSLLVALVFVFVMLFITYRSILHSIYGILPIGLTLITLFTAMGVFQIPLNIITLTMASITIGVGIDYAIHFTSLFLKHRKDNDPEEAVEKAFKDTSRPIMANALGLAIGLTALQFSPLRTHSYLSILMWVSMVSASIFTLSLLPTIYRRKSTKRR